MEYADIWDKTNINAARGRDRLKRIEMFVNIMIYIFKLFPIGFREKMFIFVRGLQGNIGLLVRYVLLKTIAKECGNNVVCHSGVYIFRPGNLSIGDNVSIHPMCYLDAVGGIQIGNDVSIAHGATLMSSTHVYIDMDIPIRDQGVNIGMIKIDDNVWIGAKSTILCGLTINAGSIVGANSVVTKNISKNVIVGGVPAKIIKYRGKNE